jgi:hypothetical protein
LNEQLSIGNYKRMETDGGAQARFCDEFINDPLYNTGGKWNYDFALCKLDKPVEMIGEVSLEINEDDSSPSAGDYLQVMGFGRLASDGDVPLFLQDVTVPYVSNNECNRADSYDGKVTEMMLCAGELGKDACQQDSGGPIVKRAYRDDGSIVDTHVGVVSWGIGCAEANHPGVYSRTSKRANWIKKTACKELKSIAPFCNDPPPPPKCDDGALLTVTLTTDSNPKETSWALIDKSKYRVVKGRQYNVKTLEYEHELCLEYNTWYDWELYDTEGNGLCDNLGCGSYVLTLNGNEIASNTNGAFESYEKVNFNTGPPPPPPPPPSPSPSPLKCKNNKNWRSDNGKSCKKYLKGSMKRIKRRCKEELGDGKRIYDECSKSCGEQAGVGPCKDLRTERLENKRK